MLGFGVDSTGECQMIKKYFATLMIFSLLLGPVVNRSSQQAHAVVGIFTGTATLMVGGIIAASGIGSMLLSNLIQNTVPDNHRDTAPWLIGTGAYFVGLLAVITGVVVLDKDVNVLHFDEIDSDDAAVALGFAGLNDESIKAYHQSLNAINVASEVCSRDFLKQLKQSKEMPSQESLLRISTECWELQKQTIANDQAFSVLAKLVSLKK